MVFAVVEVFLEEDDVVSVFVSVAAVVFGGDGFFIGFRFVMAFLRNPL